MGYGKITVLDNPGDGNDIYPSLQTAFTNASDGDTIVLPGGSFKFSDNILTTKRISLVGAIVGTPTELYRDESMSDSSLNSLAYMIKWDLTSNSPTANSNIVVKYIKTRSKIPSFSPNDSGSLAQDWAFEFTNCVNFVVKYCTFYRFGVSGIRVTHQDSLAGGLITHCSFSTCRAYNGLGFGYGVEVYGEGATWVSSPQFGTSNFIFIERCTFNEQRHSIASNAGALYVARYNYILNNLPGAAAAIDTHPASGGDVASRASEIYWNIIENTHFKIHQWANSTARNAFVPYHASLDYGIQLDTGDLYVSNGLSAGNWTLATLPKTSHLGAPFATGKNATELGETAINMRGGESVIWNNTIINWRFAIGISDPTGYAGAYPVPYSPGYASGVALGSGHSGSSSPQNDGDLMYWGNTFTPYAGATSSQEFWNYTTAYFTSGRDFHAVARPSYIPFAFPHFLNYE